MNLSLPVVCMAALLYYASWVVWAFGPDYLELVVKLSLVSKGLLFAALRSHVSCL